MGKGICPQSLYILDVAMKSFTGCTHYTLDTVRDLIILVGLLAY